MDRRIKDRHNLQLICRAGTEKVLSAPLEGTTENMSRDGILMRWLDEVPLPERGTSLVVDVELPDGAGFGPRVMRCVTTVVRIIRHDCGRTSVGLHIENVRFTEARRNAAYDLKGMQPASDRVV